ncbi:MAG: truB [Candidatus Saccharibacteria bacterium]|nr:truB [Candidatus Saccharibacteria bacterium]
MLLIDKPASWTSFDAVNYVRKIVAHEEGKKPKNCKVGHSGTLDPFATGLLILLVGKEYTRRAGEFSKLDKTYEITMQFGVTSTTGDPEGELTVIDGLTPSPEALQTAVTRFTGPIQQVPPAYSAIKVDGQRAYKLARAGKEVVIEARPVIIHRLEVVSYDYPVVQLIADVSSGTYIRTLVEDLALALGTGAYTTELRRTRIAGYDVANAVSPQAADLLSHLKTLD